MEIRVGETARETDCETAGDRGRDTETETEKTETENQRHKQTEKRKH